MYVYIYIYICRDVFFYLSIYLFICDLSATRTNTQLPEHSAEHSASHFVQHSAQQARLTDCLKRMSREARIQSSGTAVPGTAKPRPLQASPVRCPPSFWRLVRNGIIDIDV